LRHGLYLAELARRGHAGPILGADMSPGMLRAARQRAEDAGPAGPALLVADATALPLRDAAADLTLVDLDQGETLLRSAFTSVTKHDFVSKLLLPGPEPVVDYVRSMSSQVRGRARAADPGRDRQAPGPLRRCCLRGDHAQRVPGVRLSQPAVAPS
jgi:SAM-dependent methyltransferase